MGKSAPPRLVAGPRGFRRNGKLLRLAGNHTWNTLQPIGGEQVDTDALIGNFRRHWTVEPNRFDVDRFPWRSKSDGIMKVGRTPWRRGGRLRGSYYRGLDEVVAKDVAADRISGVVLFDGAFARYPGDSIINGSHPFASLPRGQRPGNAQQIHSRGPWNRYQRKHVRRVVKTLMPYQGNVILEVGNELHSSSTSWFQRAVVKWVKRFSKGRIPVGVSYATRGGDRWYARTGADFVIPSANEGTGRRPPGYRGLWFRDTDHGWALRGIPQRERRDFNRGGKALWLMDGLDGHPGIPARQQGHVLRNINNFRRSRDLLTELAQPIV